MRERILTAVAELLKHRVEETPSHAAGAAAGVREVTIR